MHRFPKLFGGVVGGDKKDPPVGDNNTDDVEKPPANVKDTRPDEEETESSRADTLSVASDADEVIVEPLSMATGEDDLIQADAGE